MAATEADESVMRAVEQAREIAVQLLAACPFMNLPLPDLWRWRDDPACAWLWNGLVARQNAGAFSSDGGKTYWLLHEREAAGSIEATPLHTAEIPERRSDA